MSGDLAPVEAPDSDEPDTTARGSVKTELAAMRRLVDTLDGLDPTTRERVFAWLSARYKHGGEG